MSVSSEDLEAIEGGYDLVVANIIHDVLQILREDLISRVKPGGQLILSGLLKGEQVESIVQKFTDLGLLIFQEQQEEGEWAVVRFLKTEE